ncbi:digalactosyldiacylglycerol synthase 2, chloroplastic-like [Zingiber officinale]|uniref:digalactosyldiacylglycerol synthase 2, chloroplastic-like n=1 Tax=Zingiber officinale TaxID=94328 RepID=UPI001C4C666F|nr:digalactosyldiacylglycerol synthase 2, chloroplastic-like [Zingiber officinale]XP_042384657.1 digalactosyldiacylglycerol synthase 2, chloroplastic-like [Zingiber officinale]
MSRKQHIAIFTTASLPWMTGTAVNPLFRAAYLTKDGDREVTLVVPWLSLDDQKLVYPNNITFSSSQEHEGYIRHWIDTRIDFLSMFNLKFYPAKFSRDKRSILPVGDITITIPDDEADVAVLEEPEHLNWYHHGRRWKSKFRKVIGIIHTNYLEYVKREKNGQLLSLVLKYANSWVTRIYCHRVIRLSAATQDYPRSIVCNVHGVNPKFLDVGKAKYAQLQSGEPAFTKGAYYIGKMVWSKGYKELLNLLTWYQNKFSGIQVDLYGSGEDSEEVQQAAKNLSFAVTVNPGRDHADPTFHDYKVFINPSTTDVVCTTTAEALAMGKIVVCANHPSNDFFKQFPNCYIYNDGEEFVKLTLKALAEEPSPLSDELRHELSWEAATQRFLAAAELDQIDDADRTPTPKRSFSSSLKPKKLKRNMENASAYIHQKMSGIEVARRAFGAIPKSLKPDEQQCRELGLVLPEKKKRKR